MRTIIIALALSTLACQEEDNPWTDAGAPDDANLPSCRYRDMGCRPNSYCGCPQENGGYLVGLQTCDPDAGCFCTTEPWPCACTE